MNIKLYYYCVDFLLEREFPKLNSLAQLEMWRYLLKKEENLKRFQYLKKKHLQLENLTTHSENEYKLNSDVTSKNAKETTQSYVLVYTLKLAV